MKQRGFSHGWWNWGFSMKLSVTRRAQAGQEARVVTSMPARACQGAASTQARAAPSGVLTPHTVQWIPVSECEQDKDRIKP